MTQPLRVSKGPKNNWRRQNLGSVRHGEALKPCNFLLGKDYPEACKRAARLEEMWDALVARWDEQRDGSEPVWEEDTYSVARSVARGETDIVVMPPPGVLATAESLEDGPAFVGMWLGGLRQLFPFLRLRLDGEDGAQVEDGAGKLAAELEEDAQRQLDVVRQLRGLTASGSLHQGLRAYADHLRATKGDKARTPLGQVALLEQHRKDQPLSQLDADAIETWLTYWCRRPASLGSGERLAFTTCRNVLITLRAFLRWLNRSPQFRWQPPGNFTFPRCKIDRLPQDLVKKRKYFKIAELTTIWQYAKPWDRALMLLALNCGFSKREIATLQSAEVIERKGNTFIARHRTKTLVYGEWVLWPETLEALDYLGRLHDGKSPYVILNQAGKPLTLGTRKGNENQIIKNHWDHIFKRIERDQPDFYKLPFKHLRKTGATFVRHLHIKNAAELASMYLSHGEKADSSDQLLPAYTERPWKKLHRALQILREQLLPVFQSVENPWESTTLRVTPKTVERILALRGQGLTYEQIAEQVGLHWVTVGRYCRRAEAKASQAQEGS